MVRKAGKKAKSGNTEKNKSHRKHSPRKPTPFEASEIYLVRAKGSKQRGGDLGGFYWHIYVGEVRAGYVFINVIDEEPFGEHASIQIKINKPLQNCHIGRVAYSLACQESGYSKVIAHMRKSNIASKQAAQAAGFTEIEDASISQFAMIWERKK